jgi:hypothetical protein
VEESDGSETTPSGSPARGSGLRQIVGLILVNTIVFLLLLLALEGLSGLALSAWAQMGREDPVAAERAHTTHDELLGWVNRPDVAIEDHYGPGLSLHTNSLGFRNREAFSKEVPAGHRRLVCSGDSFTLGYGVDDAHSWCELLRQGHPELQTVNMGQGGYGIDQAYLWYARDGARLDHDLHVFAVITDDFRRALLSSFNGHPKPVLRATDDGDIRVSNVPVPRPGGGGWGIELIRYSRLVALADKAGGRVFGDRNERTLRILTRAILTRLRTLNAERKSTLVIVYLPTLLDYHGRSSDRWREFLDTETAALGIPFVDLVSDFRALHPMDVHGLFSQPVLERYAAGAGHYTIAGNEFVARRLERHLLSLGLLGEAP